MICRFHLHSPHARLCPVRLRARIEAHVEAETLRLS